MSLVDNALKWLDWIHFNHSYLLLGAGLNKDTGPLTLDPGLLPALPAATPAGEELRGQQ